MSEEIEINEFQVNATNLLNKGVIFYGPSGSGKTTMLLHFIHEIKNFFPIGFAFAPTNQEKHELDKIFPPICVHETLKLELIRDIYERQRAATNVYNTINTIESMLPIYRLVATPKDRQFTDAMEIKRSRVIGLLKNKYGDSVEFRQQLQKLDVIYNKKLAAYYKSIIKQNKRALMGRYNNMNNNQKMVVKNIDLRPNALILFEDATTELNSLIKEGEKKKEEVIKNFFFKGRWANITHFYIFHDDKGVQTDVRKNAHISVFTNKQVASTFFSRPSNGFTTEQRKKANIIIRAVFNEDGKDSFPKHSKLIYERETDIFYYCVAKLHDNFKICDTRLHHLSETIKSKNNQSTTNKYYNKFV
jgi:ABC-type iron transport system FetAB ATPase subunit